MRVTLRTDRFGRHLAVPGAALMCAIFASAPAARVGAQAEELQGAAAAALPAELGVQVEVDDSMDLAECPDAEEIAGRIAGLGQGTGDAPGPTPLSVRFERSERGLTATLRLGDDPRARTLELHDGDCAASAEAIAMASAILIEEATKEREEDMLGQTAPTAAGSASESAVEFALPAEQAPAHEAGATEDERDFNAWLALVAAPTWGMLSGLGGVGSLRLELTWKRALLAGGAFATVPSAEAVGTGEISTWIAGAEFSGCARVWQFSASSELALCGLFSIAHLDVEARGFAQGKDEELAWYAVGGTARVHGLLMSPLLGWYAGMSSIVPLQRDVFTVDGAGAMRSGAVGLRAEVGVRCAID